MMTLKILFILELRTPS